MPAAPALPFVGAVVRYGFVWSHEAAEGTPTGRKDRPCVIAALIGTAEQPRAIVCPITHTAPTEPSDGIALSGRTKRKLGLDARAQWIIAAELNLFS